MKDKRADKEKIIETSIEVGNMEIIRVLEQCGYSFNDVNIVILRESHHYELMEWFSLRNGYDFLIPNKFGLTTSLLWHFITGEFFSKRSIDFDLSSIHDSYSEYPSILIKFNCLNILYRKFYGIH